MVLSFFSLFHTVFIAISLSFYLLFKSLSASFINLISCILSFIQTYKL